MIVYETTRIMFAYVCDEMVASCLSSSCVVTVGQRMFLRGSRKGCFYVTQTDATWTLCKLQTRHIHMQKIPNNVWMFISTLFIEIYSKSLIIGKCKQKVLFNVVYVYIEENEGVKTPSVE